MFDGGEEITHSMMVPGRRFVGIAQELEVNACVQSICSPDYTPTTNWISAKVAGLAGR